MVHAYGGLIAVHLRDDVSELFEAGRRECVQGSRDVPGPGVTGCSSCTRLSHFKPVPFSHYLFGAEAIQQAVDAATALMRAVDTAGTTPQASATAQVLTDLLQTSEFYRSQLQKLSSRLPEGTQCVLLGPHVSSCFVR